jgi:nicotinamide-nucleotide amidase
MAVAARRRANAAYALAITGVAGPAAGITPHGEAVPVGSVYVAVADAAGTHVTNRRFLGDRERIRVFTTQLALDLLRRRMEGRHLP